MQNHLNITRFFKGVYRPHPTKALLPQDISIPNVLRSVQVGISPVAAGHTLEMQTNTVFFSNVTTSGTPLRCVGRVHDLCSYALLGKLIAGLELQRRIGPPTHFLSKILTLFQGGFSNIAKVFEHDHPSSDFFRVLGQGFRSNMHEMFRNGPFAVCQSLEEAMGGPGTYGLNQAPSESDTFSQMIKFTPGEEKSIIVRGVRGNKHSLDAGIHSHNTTLSFQVRNFFFIAKNQIQFVIDSFKFWVFPTVLRNVWMMHRNGFTPKGNTLMTFIKVPFPYNWDRRVFKRSQKPSLIGFGCLISCSYLFAYTASKLRRKLKPTTEGWVIGLGESIRVHFFGIEDYRTKPVQGLNVVFDYIFGFGRAFYFNFGSSDNFHYTGSFIPI
jgi:hypothetical protein